MVLSLALEPQGKHESRAGALTGLSFRLPQGSTTELVGEPVATCLLHGNVDVVLSRDWLLLQGCWLHPGRAAGP